MEHQWHTKTVSEIFELLSTSESGLTKEESARRFKTYGANKLPEAKTDSLLIIFLRQFESPLIYVLFGASAIVFFMGHLTDALVIISVLLFNAVVGSIQEGRAQNTLSALKKLTETNATVLRANKEFIVSAHELVPGDIISLQEGEQVPADSRIITSNNLKVNEASLTGESFPVYKDNVMIHNSNIPDTNSKNMVFKGTYIVAGNGSALVVATGQSTVLGKISKKISTIDKEIPLRANIRSLSQLIVIIVAIIGMVLFFLGILYGNSLSDMFVTVVSLLVSIIPEGLPIVMTLVLANGVWRMSKRNALVKKLQAVEALGQARVIAVDKTGTITKNELMVQKVYLPSHQKTMNGNIFDVEGMGYEPKGAIKIEGSMIDSLRYQELLMIGRVSALSSNARVMFSQENQQWHVAGDPTEAAMLVLAEKIGLHKDNLVKESPRVAEIPFDYKSKYHATVHNVEGKKMLAVAGAPETILSLCKKIKRGEKYIAFSEREKQRLELDFLNMLKDGMRVVALAIKYHVPEPMLSESVQGLSFVGFLGMRDTLRPKIYQSVKKAHTAGIKVVMITGDHKITAKAIAKEAGIYKDGDEVMIGQDIDIMSDEELSKRIARVSVFARVNPEHKLRIIQAYKQNGQIVAMTGDGVNDAPSLVAADLGIAMGKIGTEVAKEAADIVLLDDNFESIVAAIEEGRNIYKTIKKVILYLFSTSFGEVFTIAGAIFLGFPLPILPAQIIWLNFVTDGFLDVALAMEPKEKNLLHRNFERPKKYLVDALMAYRMVVMALPMMVGTLFLFWLYFESDLTKAWTVSLTTLAVFQWFNTFNCRSEEKSIFQMNPFSNKFLLGATAIVIFLQFLAIYNPFLQKILHTSPLSFFDWIIILPTATLIIFIEEIRKFLYRKKLFAKNSQKYEK